MAKSRRRRFSRVRRRFHKPKMATKLIHAGLLLIATAPVLEDGLEVVQQHISPQEFQARVIREYTGFDPNSGQFNPMYLARGYAPVAGAIILGKVIGHLRRSFKV